MHLYLPTLSEHTNSTVSQTKFILDQARIDFSLDLEEHAITLGSDYTNVDVDYIETQNDVGEALGWWKIAIASENDRSNAPTR